MELGAWEASLLHAALSAQLGLHNAFPETILEQHRTRQAWYDESDLPVHVLVHRSDYPVFARDLDRAETRKCWHENHSDEELEPEVANEHVHCESPCVVEEH